MSGHLFLVPGDISQLACDAWLVTGSSRGPSEFWMNNKQIGRHALDGRSRGTWNTFQHSEVVPWQKTNPETDIPQPWFTPTGACHDTKISFFTDRAIAFLDQGHERQKQSHQPAFGRSRPLYALPLVGAGRGGANKRIGLLIRELLPKLYQWMRACDGEADVALVLLERDAYYAAQFFRRHHCELSDCWFEGDLAAARQELAKQLACQAKKGELVLFVGAGVSNSAGVPLWQNLLTDLAREKFSGGEFEQFTKLDILQQPLLLGPEVKEKVAEKMRRHSCYCLGHAFLASLPVREVITTNYDVLLESAARAQRSELRRIPWEPMDGESRWLLKMHGCCTKPASIVLTRRDYSRYGTENEVLRSIVQTVLATRQLLFVGFGLSDPNFCAILDTVKAAIHENNPVSMEPARVGKFGTALILGQTSLWKQLWGDDIAIEAFAPSDVPAETGAGGHPGQAALTAGARAIEIFLDFVAAECCSDNIPIFDEAFYFDETDSAQVGIVGREIREIVERLKQLRGIPEADTVIKKLNDLLEECGEK